jgi:hypothetical protein
MVTIAHLLFMLLTFRFRTANDPQRVVEELDTSSVWRKTPTLGARFPPRGVSLLAGEAWRVAARRSA